MFDTWSPGLAFCAFPAHVVTSPLPDAEAVGNTRRQRIDTCASVDLDDGETQSHSLSFHLFCRERITRQEVGQGRLRIACSPCDAP